MTEFVGAELDHEPDSWPTAHVLKNDGRGMECEPTSRSSRVHSRFHRLCSLHALPALREVSEAKNGNDQDAKSLKGTSFSVC